MESLSAWGPGWQMLRVSGRQAGGGALTLAGQKMDEWGWASVLMWISWPLWFSTEHFAMPWAMASAHSFPRMPTWALNLCVEMDDVFRLLDVVYEGHGVWLVYTVSCAGGSGCFIYLSALSTVAIWVRSLLFKAATIPASSAPFMHGFVDAVPPGFTVVISLDKVVLQSYIVTDKAISQNVRLLDCICKTCQTCQNCDNCCCSTRLQT